MNYPAFVNILFIYVRYNTYIVYNDKDGLPEMLRKTPIVFFFLSIGMAVIAAALRCVLTLTALDAHYGVYESGSALTVIFHIILAASVIIISVAATLKAPKRDAKYLIPRSDFTVFTSCAAAFLLAFELFISLYNTLTSNTEPAIFDILEMCFSVPAIVFFLALALTTKSRTAALALTSLFPTAWCATCLIRIYFDNSVLMTSPNKILGELALLAAMLYFLVEARNQLGMTSHRFYLAAASAAPILLFTSAVPNLLFSDKLSIGTSDSYMRYAIEAVFALFIWARLAAYAKDPEIPDNAEAIAEIGNND